MFKVFDMLLYPPIEVCSLIINKSWPSPWHVQPNRRFISDMSDICDISDICGISGIFCCEYWKKIQIRELTSIWRYSQYDMMSNLYLVFSIIINCLWFKLTSWSKCPNLPFIQIIVHKSPRFCNSHLFLHTTLDVMMSL